MFIISPVKSVQWGKEIVRTIEIYPTLGSTNEFARNLIKGGGSSGTVIWALEQTAGKGRRGSTWDADQSSLTFSLIWKCPKEQAPKNLTLTVGLGLVGALGVCTPDLKIKWPNDLWIREKKLGGILAEAVHEGGDLWVILGIGINVNASPPRGDLSPRISLQEASGRPWSRFAVLNLALVGAEQGFALAKAGEDLGDLFRQHGNFLDRQITIYHGDNVFQAYAKEVLPDGRLLIEDARGERALLPDEITVRW